MQAVSNRAELVVSVSDLFNELGLRGVLTARVVDAEDVAGKASSDFRYALRLAGDRQTLTIRATRGDGEQGGDQRQADEYS